MKTAYRYIVSLIFFAVLGLFLLDNVFLSLYVNKNKDIYLPDVRYIDSKIAEQKLKDLGFEVEDYCEYVGDEIIDEAILADDGHPEHETMLEEYSENLEVRNRWYREQEEIIISWSGGDIISYTTSIPKELVNDLESLISDDQTLYVSNEMIAELESNSITCMEDE